MFGFQVKEKWENSKHHGAEERHNLPLLYSSPDMMFLVKILMQSKGNVRPDKRAKDAKRKSSTITRKEKEENVEKQFKKNFPQKEEMRKTTQLKLFINRERGTGNASYNREFHSCSSPTSLPHPMLNIGKIKLFGIQQNLNRKQPEQGDDVVRQQHSLHPIVSLSFHSSHQNIFTHKFIPHSLPKQRI